MEKRVNPKGSYWYIRYKIWPKLFLNDTVIFYGLNVDNCYALIQ